MPNAKLVNEIREAVVEAETAQEPEIAATLLEALNMADPPIQQYILHDGPTGYDSERWNNLVPIPWTRTCGDWVDAMGVRWGNAPFATFTVSKSTPGWRDLNVTALVQKQRAQGNKGIMIKAISGSYYEFYIVGRLGTYESETPVLVVATDVSTYDCPVTATAWSSKSSSSRQEGRVECQVARNDQAVTVMQFDMSQVQGNVLSATLRLYVTRMDPLATSSVTAHVYELDPPQFLVAGAGRTPVKGLAQGYPLDAGIETHPAVVAVGNCADPSRAGGWNSVDPGPLGFEVTTTPVGTPEIRGGFKGAPNTTEKSSLVGGILKLGVHGGTIFDPAATFLPDKVGRPERVENVLYARYMLYLEDDFGGTTDAPKTPFLSPQFGSWIQRSDGTGYWNAYVGNGGSLGSGRVQLYGTRYTYCGNSIRGKFWYVPTDGNPYTGLMRCGAYIYTIPANLQNKSGFGENEFGSDVIPKGRYVCIEQKLTMNTVSNPDSDGNGIPNRDGKIDIWLNGVHVAEFSGLAFRANIYYGIESFWIDWFHGGVSPQNNPLHDMHWRISHVVVARDYIGPPEGFPIW